MHLPGQIGVMILRGATLFPQSMLPLFIFEPRYRKMLQESLESHRLFCVAMQRSSNSREVPEPVAGVGLIRASVTHPNGTSHVVLQGLKRVRLTGTVRYRPYRVHHIEPQATISEGGAENARQLDQLRQLIERRLELGAAFPGQASTKGGTTDQPAVKAQDILHYLDSLGDPEQLADMVACSFLTDAHHRQRILETPELGLRLQHLSRYLRQEIRRLEEGDPQ